MHCSIACGLRIKSVKLERKYEDYDVIIATQLGGGGLLATPLGCQVGAG